MRSKCTTVALLTLARATVQRIEHAMCSFLEVFVVAVVVVAIVVVVIVVVVVVVVILVLLKVLLVLDYY